MSQTLFLKTLSDAAKEMIETPLFGSPPPFPYEEFAEALSKLLETDSIKTSTTKTDWVESENLLEGMGKSPAIQPLALSPLPGSLFLVMPEKFVEKLLQLLLKQKTLSDPTLRSGFLQYCLVKILDSFNTLNPYGNLTCMLADESPLPEEGALAIEIAVTIGAEKQYCKILIPQDVRASFKSHFTMEDPPLLTDPSLLSMPMPIHLEVGSTTLNTEEWNQVSVGDFILLDRCTFSPKEGRGTAILALGNTPLFDVRIKEGECKILEHALTQEAPVMTEQNEELPPPPSPPEDSSPAESGEKEKITPSGKIPLQITVEVGRLQMPLEKVSELTPGNILELGVGPSPDVFLTVGGKRIAKGELVNLGEALGVKVLKLGD
ncbi:MAG: type III secretion system cytoplasmic ring protein SctQ [Simkaniaceae bacterium]|nr:type III secretion system cytoplasmic ring protein SctQ [Candidatus Sacchlamyda saccharinae]